MIAAAILYTAAFTALVLAFWFGAKVVRTVRGPVEPTCSLDCRDKYRYGLTDRDCPVPHATNHFAMTREEVGLINDLDGQIGFTK